MRRTLLIALASLCLSGPAAAEDSTDVWPMVQASLFGTRPITTAGPELVLFLPARAEDAAVVPITILTRPRPGMASPRKLHLFIDRNPSPVAAIFEFGEAAGNVEIETRVRVETNSPVRVVAEFADGSLSMTTKFIEAAGGCSAPGNKRAADASTLGRMRWQLPDTIHQDIPNAVALLIRHPSTSGLAVDQTSHIVESPQFVRTVRVLWRDRLVMSANVDFSISENPTFRFNFIPDGEGTLSAEVVDSSELRFESSVPVAGEARQW
jgi:sulfur-oxidizing protein SoxY